GAYLGALDQALAAHNNGGIVIAQVKRLSQSGTLKPHDVHVPGILVDHIVIAPDRLQTTQTAYDPAISGEIFRPLDSFRLHGFDVAKTIARRVALELKAGWAVNLGFGISANVPRILLEEGRHGAVTWVIEQGAVGGVPLLDFQFGCASNAEAILPSPHQFTYFQGGGFDASLLSFLQIDREGSVNVSSLPSRPHVTAGAGGFVDITAQAKRIVFSGYFNAGAKLAVEKGQIRIEREGKVKKLVPNVDHVSFSGRRAVAQGQEITYVTERCVMKLTPSGIVVTEIAPGIELARDVLAQADFPLLPANDMKTMPEALFHPAPIGLDLPQARP
ncbi:MAG TPA: acyl CoA:acetate/3-ketoacid CoA transferase, partial [Dongiaceae bacterium]